LVHEATGDTP